MTVKDVLRCVPNNHEVTIKHIFKEKFNGIEYSYAMVLETINIGDKVEPTKELYNFEVETIQAPYGKTIEVII